MSETKVVDVYDPKVIYALAVLYRKSEHTVTVATLCDSLLDRTGALLGFVRDESMRLGKKEPIHCLEFEYATHLINKNIVYANDKEGLGCYGTLLGQDKETGKFSIKDEYSGKTGKAAWIAPMCIV